jgi:hypothetical protein
MKTISWPRTSFACAGAFAVLLVLLATACGDDDNSNSQQGSESAVCGDINAFDSAVDQVRDLNSSSSIDDISRSLSNLRTTGSDLIGSLKDAKYDKTDQIQAVTSDLQNALVKAVNSGSAAQAQAEINSAAQDVQSDLSDAKDNANCN